MEKKQIEDEILTYFYNCWEIGANCTIHSIFKNLPEIDKRIIERVADELEDAGLMVGLKSSPYGDLTAQGIIVTERKKIIPAEKVRRNYEVRYKILESAFKIYDSFGSDESTEDDAVISEHNLSESEFRCNFKFLEDLGMIYGDTTNTFDIKKSGIEQFKIWQKQRSFGNEFERLSNLDNITPQQRGRDLEKLIAEVLEFAGWNQERNVTTSYEQIDIVIHYNREFYLIECKWEKNPIEADVVDKLFGKLGRRAGTNGILMSMSGFTKGCEDCVKDLAGQKLFLLFGEESIKQIISNPKSFEALFNNKYKELVMRRYVDRN